MIGSGTLSARTVSALFISFIAALLFHSSISFGQSSTADAIRIDTHARLLHGHLPLAYGQTDKAMALIHADLADPEHLILFYTGRSQDIDQWVNVDSQNGWNREHL